MVERIVVYGDMIEYRVIRELERNPLQTQRELAKKLEVSLGKINYVLSGLVEKGIIKIKKLKNHPEKIRFKYILPPEGIREKIRITKRYLKKRMEEYEEIRREIEELKRELENNGTSRKINNIER